MDDFMKKYFAGIHGLVPTPKVTLTGKVSKLVKKSK